jgi:hypothetical protein
MTVPASITKMRDETFITSSMSCSMSTTPMPLLRELTERLARAPPFVSFNPAAGSSSNRYDGSVASARGDLDAPPAAVRQVTRRDAARSLGHAQAAAAPAPRSNALLLSTNGGRHQQVRDERRLAVSRATRHHRSTVVMSENICRFWKRARDATGAHAVRRQPSVSAPVQRDGAFVGGQ